MEYALIIIGLLFFTGALIGLIIGWLLCRESMMQTLKGSGYTLKNTGYIYQVKRVVPL